MPPKKVDASKKTTEKKKNKIIEDKTFGLKNKKGKKQQQFVKNVEQQVKGQKSNRQLELEITKKKEKKAELLEMKELQSLIKPIIEKQKIEPGVDPKSVLCAYFKQGVCTKGDKCKFSHDLTIERKQEKRDLFTDSRDKYLIGDEEIRDLNQEDLEELINEKHGSSNKNRTEIVCKYFIEAVEKRLYGWFWVCPNGGDNCPYRHCLPPDYQLKRDRVAPKIIDEISIEELIEKERINLEGDLTPITQESFMVWKAKKIQEKKKIREQEMLQKRDELASGRITSKISGKDAFQLDPSMIKNDDEEANDENFTSEQDQTNMAIVNVDKLLEGGDCQRVSDEKATKVLSLNPKDRSAIVTHSTYKTQDDDESSSQEESPQNEVNNIAIKLEETI